MTKWTYNRELNYVTDNRGEVVCENIAATHPAGHVEHTPQSDARGQLIEAAPDLLAALQEAADYITAKDPASLYLGRIRAAIDKATRRAASGEG